MDSRADRLRDGTHNLRRRKERVKNMKIKLIQYSETPQVTGLEYDEMRDLREHPEKKDEYGMLVHQRKVNDAKKPHT